jgi:uncharacterized BrkB/YihY/UPF0761 family membrane protein
MRAKKAMWAAMVTGAGTLGMAAVRTGLNQAWRFAKEQDPPDDPASLDVTWRDAIAWTLATSIVIGLGRLFALRGAAAGWTHLTGEAPPQ